MSAREFLDWQSFLAEHPLPMELVDLHGAMAHALIVNVNRSKNTPVADPQSYRFLRERRAPQQRQQPLSTAQRMKAIAEHRGS